MAMSYDVKLKQTARVEGRYNTGYNTVGDIGNNNRGYNTYNSVDKSKNSYNTYSNGCNSKAAVEMSQYGSTSAVDYVSTRGRAFYQHDGKEHQQLTTDEGTNDGRSYDSVSNDVHSDDVNIRLNSDGISDGGIAISDENNSSKTLKVNEPPAYGEVTSQPSRLAISDYEEELNVESNQVTTGPGTASHMTKPAEDENCKYFLERSLFGYYVVYRIIPPDINSTSRILFRPPSNLQNCRI